MFIALQIANLNKETVLSNNNDSQYSRYNMFDARPITVMYMQNVPWMSKFRRDHVNRQNKLRCLNKVNRLQNLCNSCIILL